MQSYAKRFLKTGILLTLLGGLVNASPVGQAAGQAADQAADLLHSVQGTFTIDFNGLPVGCVKLFEKSTFRRIVAE